LFIDALLQACSSLLEIKSSAAIEPASGFTFRNSRRVAAVLGDELDV